METPSPREPDAEPVFNTELADDLMAIQEEQLTTGEQKESEVASFSSIPKMAEALGYQPTDLPKGEGRLKRFVKPANDEENGFALIEAQQLQYQPSRRIFIGASLYRERNWWEATKDIGELPEVRERFGLESGTEIPSSQLKAAGLRWIADLITAKEPAIVEQMLSGLNLKYQAAREQADVTIEAVTELMPQVQEVIDTMQQNASVTFLIPKKSGQRPKRFEVQFYDAYERDESERQTEALKTAQSIQSKLSAR